MGFSFQAELPWFIVGFYAALFLAIRRFGSHAGGDGAQSPRADIFVKVRPVRDVRRPNTHPPRRAVAVARG